MAKSPFVGWNVRLILGLAALLALAHCAGAVFSVSLPPRTWRPAAFNPNATLSEQWTVWLCLLAAARAKYL